MQLFMWQRDLVVVAHYVMDYALGALSDAPDGASTSTSSALVAGFILSFSDYKRDGVNAAVRHGYSSIGIYDGHVRWQAVAALSELAIPHFMTATIFSVTATGSKAKFYQNVKLLAVRKIYCLC